MSNDTFKSNISRWLELQKSGKTKDAKRFYYDELFDDVLQRFNEKETGNVKEHVDVLFSILGYSPEPVVMAANLFHPEKHIIFQDLQVSQNVENSQIIRKYLQGTVFVTLYNESFGCIYDTLKEQLTLYPGHCTINITGGKKSMAASAGIFARDFSCNLIYIDYNEYDPESRRPLPGSEYLNLVYDPKRDMPELFHL